jgi:hypothetical protein
MRKLLMRSFTHLENKRIRNPAQGKTLIQPQVCDDKLAARHSFQVLQGAQRVPFLHTPHRIINSKGEGTDSATKSDIISQCCGSGSVSELDPDSMGSPLYSVLYRIISKRR